MKQLSRQCGDCAEPSARPDRGRHCGSVRHKGADAVSDEVWDEAAHHYDEPALAALVLNIALINCWNRINATTRQVAGSVRH